MAVLVIAEHDNQELNTSTLSSLTAAEQLDKDISLLVAGYNCNSVAQAAAKYPSVKKVLLADDKAYQFFLAEHLAPLIASIANQFTHVITPATTFGKNILPRVGALIDSAPITDIIAIESHDTFIRPIYAGNALATVQSIDNIKLITIRTTSFPPATLDNNTATPIISVTHPVHQQNGSTFIQYNATVSFRPELSTAKVVVSGGRGLQSAENFKLIEELADCLHGAIGASRAAVDAGYISNDHQVGQTGKIVAPNLYIAIGISGAIQHIAGMKDSKTIVAINKDPDAAIFDIADYGLVGDLFEIIPQLIKELKKI